MDTSDPVSLHGASDLAVPAAEQARLLAGEHRDPHSILGVHPSGEGLVVRAFHPDAESVDLLDDTGQVSPLEPRGGGLFAAFFAGGIAPGHRHRFRFRDGRIWEQRDPYRFAPTLGELDMHLFAQGNHRRLWDKLGAHVRALDGVEGVAFAVWAPTARRVSVVGDFVGWDGRLLPMRSLGSSGVFELFVPGLEAGALYKYEILSHDGLIRVKTDPFARSMELAPGTASRVEPPNQHAWGDAEWMAARRTSDRVHGPLSVYEVHPGSWMRGENDRVLSWRELAPRLAAHVKRLGFTHIELLPVMEHPFTGSWGYQVSGYYAPTARHGTPEDFRAFVDELHQHGIGVILDWVPAHFPKDDFALRRFDGTAVYEHEDPRLGEHPDWGTLIFNYGRSEVRNFLLANALYWLFEFHVDGIRVDAVASMLYLDYSREPGEWLPNRFGGRENLDAIELLRSMNAIIHEEHPGVVTIAEESTSWPGVTRPVWSGGLGFDFKWNLGWMHDTLGYLARDPVHRAWHHDSLTFAVLYEATERFLMPLSHDEVVHLKKSLLEKMPGDLWQRFANLRLLLAYQWLRPGKKLVFMGTEIAPYLEWNHDVVLDWSLAETPECRGLLKFFEELGRLYRAHPSLWAGDHEPWGFRWIDCTDRAQSVVSWLRQASAAGGDPLVVVASFTPVPHDDYRIGVPRPGAWVEKLQSDEARFGGSGYGTWFRVETEPVAAHGHAQSVRLRLPPLAAIVLAPEAAPFP